MWNIVAVGQLLATVSALTISDAHTNSSSSLLNGIVFEDINHSGDGGIYGELLANRAFQGLNRSTANYTGINGAQLSLVNVSLSKALTQSLKVEGDGFWNSGWWGIKIEPDEYTARFYHKQANSTSPSLKVSLKGVSSGKTYASAVPKAVRENNGVYVAQSNGFQLYEAKLKPTESAPDLDNGFYVEGNGFFNLISLFGSTLNNRPNGLRKDIAEAVKGFDPHFLRFPGANNLEGDAIRQRWKWNETIGPLINRPGREDPWGYPQTDGLGLHEYFDWIEDMNLEPILGLYAGYSLADVVVPESDLQPYIDDVINEIEYITGDASSTYGRLRAQNGRQDPWNLKYVEIGNEDFISELAQTTYDGYRYDLFYKAIKSKFPQLTTIATTKPNEFPKNDTEWWDQHKYLTPSQFIKDFNVYDSYPRNNTKVFVGEYAATNFDNGTHIQYPTAYSAVSEAVYMLGLERNSDQVVASCYAPILQNVKSTQWYPNMISFDAGSITLSTSYYVQKLFSSSQGNRILSLENAEFDPLYYVANLNSNSDTVHIKIANPTGKTLNFTADIGVGGFSTASASAEAICSTHADAQNIPFQSQRVSLEQWPVKYKNRKISLQIGPYFVGVVTLKKQGEALTTTSGTALYSTNSTAAVPISSTPVMTSSESSPVVANAGFALRPPSFFAAAARLLHIF